MSRWDAYLNNSVRIVEQYDGRIPLSAWLKNFFREHRQMGGKDRKIITELVYSFYRLGHSAVNIPVEERILAGLFLCNQSSNEVLLHLRPQWNESIQAGIDEKLAMIKAGLPAGADLNVPGSIFPWNKELSEGIDASRFNLSFLRQPDLFLRIRPGNKDNVTRKLSEAGIAVRHVNEECVAVSNSTRVGDIIDLDREAVIQDYNSQQAGNYFKVWGDNRGSIDVWDCCAASGGKSIMAYDLFQEVRLTVSDIRASILSNLQKRFLHAGIKDYQVLLTDLSMNNCKLPGKPFDLIICDLPCSGSGTWARTPEQLYFFDTAKIQYYSSLQKKILSHVIPSLKKGGRIVYITCSVFKEENEEVANFISHQSGLELKSIELLKGYNDKADSMFVAVLGG